MINKTLTFSYLFFFSIQSYTQTKIVFTSIDYSNEEVRAVICEDDGNNRNELGFSKTYLPVWFNDKILLNSDTFIWQCDTSGENLSKLFPGYKVSVSNNKKMFAFYDKDGIGIADLSNRIVKQIMVNAFKDAAITWSKNDDRVSYFDPEKGICYLFNLTNDSLEVFGDSIFHPLWNLNNDYVLYNQTLSDGKFDVVLKNVLTGLQTIINKKDENVVVPIWSNFGNKVAYLSFNDNIENLPQTDLYPCRLVLYDIESKNSTTLSTEAAFTDKAFPQMCFDNNDEFIYFTKINENGLGSIARVNLKNLNQDVISRDLTLDERFPQVCIFK